MKACQYRSVAFFCLLCSPALANDSSATLAAGGLQLVKSDDIAMESEQLYISSQRISVDYVFKNNSAVDIKTWVAFPLPKLVSDEDLESNIAVGIPNPNAENFVNFQVVVENKKVPLHIAHQAFFN